MLFLLLFLSLQGFPEYLGSAFMEWFIVILNALFILSFTREFKQMGIKTVVELKSMSEIPTSIKRQSGVAKVSPVGIINHGLASADDNGLGTKVFDGI